MRICNINNAPHFGRFEKKTAQKLLDEAKGDVSTEATTKAMIMYAGRNHDFHIKEVEGGYKVYSDNAYNNTLNLAPNIKLKRPLDAVLVADNCTERLYRFLADFWGTKAGSEQANILDKVTIDEEV